MKPNEPKLRLHARAAPALLLVLASIYPIGCGSDDGSDSYDSLGPYEPNESESSRNRCEPESSSTSCERCVKSRCCDEYLRCDDSESCVDAIHCIEKCSTESCAVDCTNTYPEGSVLLFQLVECSDARCNDHCSSEGPEPSGTPPDAPGQPASICTPSPDADACEACILTSCCGDTTACTNDEECSSAYSCLAECSTESCIESCAYSYPRGTELLANLLSCAEAACARPCG